MAINKGILRLRDSIKFRLFPRYISLQFRLRIARVQYPRYTDGYRSGTEPSLGPGFSQSSLVTSIGNRLSFRYT